MPHVKPLIASPIASPILSLDCAAAARQIENFLVQTTGRQLHRRGLVLGVSGGIDSAVCATLAVRALGADQVFALLMPERDSSDEATQRALRLCTHLGVRHVVEDISPTLEAIGCYHRRDEAIRQVFPDFQTDWRQKIVINVSDDDLIPHFSIVVEEPGGETFTKRMPTEAYLQVVASTNFKQRTRKTLEYYHAERQNYAVIGTPNRLEYELGFFVRGGDGLADVKPIAHLYKTQVYALAEHLGVAEEICRQPPSTDTYSLPQTQEEFYFALSYDRADIVLHAMNNGVPPEEIAPQLGMTASQMKRVYRDFEGKQRVAERSLRNALVIGEPD